MSVYIKLLYAELSVQPTHNVYTMISSSSSLLTTNQKSKSKRPQWNSSIISSHKEQQLHFHLYENKGHDQKLIGSAQLNKITTLSRPSQLFEYNVPLKSKSEQVGTLFLSILYNNKKTYIGDVQFYKNKPDLPLENIAFDRKTYTKTETTLNVQSPYIQNSKTNQNTQYEFNANNLKPDKKKQQIKFYKGSCKNKNLFSMLDVNVEDQQFEIVQPRYI